MYNQIADNKRKTVILMGVFLALVAGLAWLFGTFSGRPVITPFVVAGAAIYALIMYLSGSRLALAVNGAKPISKRDNPRLYRLVENLSISQGLPTPAIYIIEDTGANAFATGRTPYKSAVAVTTGLLEMMNDQELEGVLAHELGHIKNYDIRVSMVAFGLVAVVSLLADFMLRLAWFRDDDNNNNQAFFVLGIVAAILAPLVATMIQLAVSRRREYLADATGALTTRYPDGLASALAKLGGSGGRLRRQNASTAHLFFVNPLRGGSLAALFSTHPPIAERIARLRAMDNAAGE